MAISSLSASSIVASVQLAPVKPQLQCRDILKRYESGVAGLGGGSLRLKCKRPVADPGSLHLNKGPTTHASQLYLNCKGPVTHTSRGQSASLICAAALNARCGAEQTQTVERQSSTITVAPVQGKEKSPELDDGGTGFPPRDDGGGGGAAVAVGEAGLGGSFFLVSLHSLAF
ncbi:hypothetical protein Ancab_024900 [Ancistrocladus abbreviatus]